MERLIQEGWSLDDEALSDICGVAEGCILPQRAQLLDTDIKKFGKSALPDDVNRAESKQIAGPCILQIESAQDVSCPSKGAVHTTKQRMLLLKLTDGKRTAKAVEWKPCACLDPNKIPPGTKVQLTGATVRNGVLLLDDHSIKVLGGRVEALVSAWEFQRRFGGERPVESSSSGPGGKAKAPEFTPYVPGRTRVPKEYLPGNAGQPRHAKALVTQPPPGFANTQTISAPASVSAHPNGFQSAGSAVPAQQMQHEVQRRADGRAAAEAVPLDKARAQGAAKQKLLERLTDSQAERSRGRGRGRFRRRDRDNEEDDGSMTLAEYEARQKRSSGLAGQSNTTQSDEELARKMQEQLDLEDGGHHAATDEAPGSAAEELRKSLFSFSGPHEEARPARGGRRGRGRSRGRGRLSRGGR